jgi:LysR family hydrogen peroxide-inducible transcriptional activator
MEKLTLKQLRYFEALARERHFGRAAEACAISQPALSMQIRQLEETLGTVLFERDVRKLRLTRFGEEFAFRAKAILRSVDELGELARSMGEEMFGRIRIGIIPTIAPYLLPSILETLAARYPGLEVHVRETLTQKLIDELADGRLDTAIVALPVSEAAFSEVALFEENFVLVRPLQDNDKPVPNVDALHEMKLLLLEEGHCFRDQALSFCQPQSAGPREGLDGSSLSTLVQMVAAGMGVTLIPDMAVPVETRSTAVALARFEPPQPSRTIGMIWRKTNPLAGQFIEISEAVMRSANASAAAQA